MKFVAIMFALVAIFAAVDGQLPPGYQAPQYAVLPGLGYPGYPLPIQPPYNPGYNTALFGTNENSNANSNTNVNSNAGGGPVRWF